MRSARGFLTLRAILPALLAATAIGCKDDAAEKQAPATPAPSTPDTDDKATSAIAKPSAEKPTDGEEGARALLESWLAAQNGGDFAAYSALYGDSFTGVRRTKGKAVELDRAGWLAERQRMFKRPMRVLADDIQIEPAEGGQHLVARFIQTWASGSYADRGAKEMWLAQRGDRTVILHEELLESQVIDPSLIPPQTVPAVASPSATKPLDQLAGDVRPVLHLGARILVPIARAPARFAPSGKPVLVGHPKGRAGVFQAIDEASLPSGGARTGEAVALYGAAGHLCDARITAVGAVGGSYSEATDAEVQASPDAVAAAAWHQEPGMPLVGVIEKPPAGCQGALFALPAGAPAPRYGVSGAATRKLEKRLIAALLADKEWADAVGEKYQLDVLDAEDGSERKQRRLARENPAPTDERFLAEQLQGTWGGWSDNKPEIALLNGEVYVPVQRVFAIDGSSASTLLSSCGGTEVAAAADVDGDQRLDLVITSTAPSVAVAMANGHCASFDAMEWRQDPFWHAR